MTSAILCSQEPEKYGSWYRPPDGVYVDADIRLRPVETLDGVPFHEQVIKVLKSFWMFCYKLQPNILTFGVYIHSQEMVCHDSVLSASVQLSW